MRTIGGACATVSTLALRQLAYIVQIVEKNRGHTINKSKVPKKDSCLFYPFSLIQRWSIVSARPKVRKQKVRIDHGKNPSSLSPSRAYKR